METTKLEMKIFLVCCLNCHSVWGFWQSYPKWWGSNSLEMCVKECSHQNSFTVSNSLVMSGESQLWIWTTEDLLLSPKTTTEISKCCKIKCYDWKLAWQETHPWHTSLAGLETCPWGSGDCPSRAAHCEALHEESGDWPHHVILEYTREPMGSICYDGWSVT